MGSTAEIRRSGRLRRPYAKARRLKCCTGQTRSPCESSGLGLLGFQVRRIQLATPSPSAARLRCAAFALARSGPRLARSDMPATKEPDSLDSKFYKPADAFFPAYSNLGLTYDDVTLATRYSEVLPRDTQLDTTLAEGLQLNIPVISADMDTVTESRMAIAHGAQRRAGLHPLQHARARAAFGGQPREEQRPRPDPGAHQSGAGAVDRGGAGVDCEEALCLQHVPGRGRPGQAGGAALGARRQAALRQTQGRGVAHAAQPDSHAQQEGAGPRPHCPGRQVLHRPPRHQQAAGGGRPGPAARAVHDERCRAHHAGAERAVQAGARRAFPPALRRGGFGDAERVRGAGPRAHPGPRRRRWSSAAWTWWRSRPRTATAGAWAIRCGCCAMRFPSCPSSPAT